MNRTSLNVAGRAAAEAAVGREVLANLLLVASVPCAVGESARAREREARGRRTGSRVGPKVGAGQVRVRLADVVMVVDPDGSRVGSHQAKAMLVEARRAPFLGGDG